MFTDEQQEVMGRCIRTWGKRQQVIKAIEEMGELTQALSKWLNLEVKVMRDELHAQDVIDSVREELADVTIMLHQMHHIFGDTHLLNYIDAKLKRLKGYLPADNSPSATEVQETKKDG